MFLFEVAPCTVDPDEDPEAGQLSPVALGLDGREDEHSPLLSRSGKVKRSVSTPISLRDEEGDAERLHAFALTFAGLNALEIAAVSDAKRFLSQRSVQRVVTGIWVGDIVFWDSVSVHSKKKARLYDQLYSPPRPGLLKGTNS